MRKLFIALGVVFTVYACMSMDILQSRLLMAPYSLDYTENMLAWWKMESTNGNVVADSVGASTMSLFGSPALVEGKVGSGALRTATSKYGKWTPLPASSNFTICGWYKTSTPSSAMSFLGNSLDGTVYVFLFTTNSILIKFLSGDNFFTIPPFPSNTWTHITYTSSNSNTRLYFNGVQSTTGSKLASSVSLHRLDQISRYAGTSSNPWNGDVDDVRIYNKPLSISEIQLIYNATK